MEYSQKKRSRGIYTVLTISLVSLAVVALAGVYYYKQAKDAKEELHNTYMRALHDMGDYVNDIDVSLKKTLLAGDKAQLSALSTQLYMQSEAAKACLSQMPIENVSFDKTQKFLAQVGDYSSYLSKKSISENKITDEEYNNLSTLSSYAAAVNEEFTKLENSVYDGTIKVEMLNSASPFIAYAESTSFADGLSKIDSLPQEYPSLIYDGPFSDHLETTEPELLKGKEAVSKHSAEKSAKNFLGDERGTVIKYDGEGNGLIETYMFSGNKGNRSISMEVTKKGGLVLWMLDSREVASERLTVNQAMAAGENFLIQKGYHSMKSSYYEVADNIATVNYAYYENNTVMYPDLVKVKIAMDNGEILGFESQGYIMCHRERAIPQNVIGEERAREIAGLHLSIDTVSMAYIPLDSGREVYCYELKGTLGKNNFLIYVNAETGQEEKILMLIETESGILTI